MDAPLAKKSAPIQKYINISVVWQAAIGFLGCIQVNDDGTAIRLVIYSALAYWIAVIVIVNRRLKHLTKGDKIFISCAYPMVFILMAAFLGSLASYARSH
jgi:hypothetical protein